MSEAKIPRRTFFAFGLSLGTTAWAANVLAAPDRSAATAPARNPSADEIFASLEQDPLGRAEVLRAMARSHPGDVLAHCPH